MNQIVTNHPPTATVMTVSLAAGGNVEIALSDLATNWSDVDGDTVELTAIDSTTTNGVTLALINTTTNNDGSYVITNNAFISYTNNLDVNDQFSYTISDGFGGTNTGIVNIIVNPFVSGAQITARSQWRFGEPDLLWHPRLQLHHAALDEPGIGGLGEHFDQHGGDQWRG